MGSRQSGQWITDSACDHIVTVLKTTNLERSSIIIIVVVVIIIAAIVITEKKVSSNIPLTRYET